MERQLASSSVLMLNYQPVSLHHGRHGVWLILLLVSLPPEILHMLEDRDSFQKSLILGTTLNTILVFAANANWYFLADFIIVCECVAREVLNYCSLPGVESVDINTMCPWSWTALRVHSLYFKRLGAAGLNDQFVRQESRGEFKYPCKSLN